MIPRILLMFTQGPTWQRYLVIAASIVLTAFLFWIGLLFVFGFAVFALVVALINQIKMKITGRPLFKGPQHFHRYQSQFRQHTNREPSQGNVIEGEVVHNDQPEDKS